MSSSIKKYINSNLQKIIKIATIYIIAIIIGITIFIFSDIKSSQYFTDATNIFSSGSQNIQNVNVITNGLKNNMLIIILLYLTSITIICPVLVLTLIGIKGIISGIYIATIITIFRFGKGILVTFLAVVIPQLILLPAYIILCINVLNAYNDIIINRKIEFSNVIKQIYLFVISFSLISFSIVLEQFTTSIIIKLIQ